MMASTLSRASSRSPPPGKSIDDLTTALSNFSRAHTPDPQVICCCGRETCATTKAWAALRAKLESRLVLSAEVGQALLERHEAYVRRQDALHSRQASSILSFSFEDDTSLQQHAESLTKKLDAVTEENTIMESRLNEFMIKNEMTDASNRTILRELQESRATIGRLSAQNARSAGWEMRLNQVTQERDDMRQERDSEAHRARHAESKAAAFVDKCSKLQNEVYALREEVNQFRASRADFSKNVLQEARSRLESLQHSLGQGPTREDPETTHVLESLVADNETLKRDIAELQNLLVESREDVRVLHEDLEEHRASAPSLLDDMTKVGTPPPPLGASTLYIPRSPAQVVLGGRPRGHHHPTNSSGSASSMHYGLPHVPNLSATSPRTPATQTGNHWRSVSGNARLLGDDAIAEWRNTQEDNTLLPPLRPRSPADLLVPPPHLTRHSPSHHDGDSDYDSPSPSKGNVKQLLLLTRTRGVQTDPLAAYAYPSPRPSMVGVDRDSSPSTPAPEGRSDTSSINQQDPRTVAALLERVMTLLTRMIQADVKTLSNRLKRQHLGSGDVGHLSKTTISGILNEVAGLRVQMSSGRDDTFSITRADCKALLKFAKDAIAELGALREQINEVVLDPAVAQRLRKEALESEKVKGDVRPSSAMGGWIAPIQKLFAHPMSSSGASMIAEAPSAVSKPAADPGRGRTPSRVVPKLAPAISATSTTVNVEFASSGVRKTDTSENAGQQRVSLTPAGGSNQLRVTGPTALQRPIPVPHTSSSRHLMGIFAGAPQSFTNPLSVGQNWVVLPKSDKDRVRQLKGATSSVALGGIARPGIAGRVSARNSANRLSRNVDAVIDQNDDDVPDFRETLLDRTLRPRGLSDSSIHTSFMKGEPSAEEQTQRLSDSSTDTELGSPYKGAPSPRVFSPVTPQSSPPTRPQYYAALDRERRERSPVAKLGRNLASWATAAAGGLTDLDLQHNSLLIGSPPREEGILHPAAWSRRGLDGREL